MVLKDRGFVYRQLGSYVGPKRASTFVRYMSSTLEREREDMSFRVYVTESLRLRGENRYISVSWYDMLSKEQDDRTAEEIVDDVASSLESAFGGLQ